jgi:hypothetical protein
MGSAFGKLSKAAFESFGKHEPVIFIAQKEVYTYETEDEGWS